MPHRHLGPDFSSASIAAGYDAIAGEYARHFVHELDHKPFDRSFLDGLAASAHDGLVLDIGCGPGHVTKYLSDRGCRVCGVDISPAMVEAASLLNPGIRFQRGDMRNLEFEDGTFSAIVAFYSIIHLEPSELGAAFAELRRALVPGGLLGVAFHIGTDVLHVDEIWGVKTSIDLAFFEPHQVVEALGEAGLTVVEATERPPYDQAIEYQSRRCYVVAQRPHATLCRR